MKTNFDGFLIYGEEAESLVGKMLPGYVIYTGRAREPGASGGGRLYKRDTHQANLPDLQHFSEDGEPCWFEVKRKRQPVFVRFAQEYRHGIDLNCLENYERVSNETGWPVFVVVCEDHGPEGKSGEVLAIGIDRIRYWGQKPYRNSDGSMMVAWPRNMMWPLPLLKACGGFVK
jgi:hypothetical protein